MATVNKSLADKIVEGNGFYGGDQRALRIVEYTDMGGKRAYGVEYSGQIGKYSSSPYVRLPKVYWEAK